MNKHKLLLALNGLEHWLVDGSADARLGLEEAIVALKEEIKAEPGPLVEGWALPERPYAVGGGQGEPGFWSQNTRHESMIRVYTKRKPRGSRRVVVYEVKE